MFKFLLFIRFPRGYRVISLCTSINSGTDADYEYVHYQAQNITDTSAKNDLLSSLSCTRNQSLLTEYLKDQLSNPNYILTALINVATKPSGNLVAWSFLKQNWEQIYSLYSPFYSVKILSFYELLTKN